MKVVFAQSMEGIYRALTPHTPQERAAFLKAGVKGDRFDAGYPVEAWIEILDASAASRFSHLTELDRFAEVGRTFFSGFEKTLIGKALTTVAKLIGPRRMLERMTRNLRSANNFTESTLESLAPNHHLVRISYTARPGFFLGLLESSCLLAGAKGLTVRVVETKNMASVYELKWT